jgi:hypothetical protein
MLLLPIMPRGYWDRILTMVNISPMDVTMQTESSLRGRSSEMIIAGQMFEDHPLIGVGSGNYPVNYLRYSMRLGLDDRLQDRQAHSLILETAAELGAAGLFAFALLLTTLFVGLRRAKRQLYAIQRADLAAWITATGGCWSPVPPVRWSSRKIRSAGIARSLISQRTKLPFLHMNNFRLRVRFDRA